MFSLIISIDDLLKHDINKCSIMNSVPFYSVTELVSAIHELVDDVHRLNFKKSM